MPKLEYISKIVANIIDNDLENLLLSLQEIIDEGKDLDNFLWEVIKYIKDVLVYKAVGELELYNKQEKEVIHELSEKVTKGRLLELLYMLSELSNLMKWSSQKAIMLQSGLIKACLTNENIEHVISSVKNKDIKAELKKDKKNKGNKSEELDEITTAKKEAIKEASKDNSSDNYLSYWPKILDSLKTNGKVILYTNLIGTKAKKVNDLQIEIEFAGKITTFAKSVLEQTANKEEIIKILSKEEGKNIQIRYVEENSTAVVNNAKLHNQNIDIPINIIDE